MRCCVKAVLSVIFLSLCALPVYASASPEPTEKTIEKEIRMGRKYTAEVEASMPRLVDVELEKKLARIANRLIPQMSRMLHYEVRVLKADEMNAFSLPGGYTYITTGMLNALKTDDEIAAVLAHEFVHADRAHVLVQTAKNSKLNVVSIAGILAAVAGAGAGAAVVASALQTAMVNSYTIELEKEADERGIEALYNAGYNPSAMLVLMELLKEETIRTRSYSQLGIYQTHPEEEERIASALTYMKRRGIRVERKKINSVLQFEIKESLPLEKLYLNVDGINIVTLPMTASNEEFLQRLKAALEHSIELELAPFDFYIMDTEIGKALAVLGSVIVYAKELPEGAPSLQQIRDTVNAHLIELRGRNPFTDYFL